MSENEDTGATGADDSAAERENNADDRAADGGRAEGDAPESKGATEPGGPATASLGGSGEGFERPNMPTPPTPPSAD